MWSHRALRAPVAPLLALLWSVGFGPTPAHADVEAVVEPPALPAAHAGVGVHTTRHFGTTQLGVDPDTVYVGHVVGNTSLPGTPGGDGPYHVGRGGRRVEGARGPRNADNNGYWDWDRFNAGETDSLQGWWPLNRGIGTTGGVTLNDRLRASHGLDYGNLGCYVINQGAPKRSFGVVSYWHRDPGARVPGLPDSGSTVAGPGVEWTPLSGSYSAWCGLRGAGDRTVLDPVTGNPYDSSVLDRAAPLTPGVLTGALSPGGTDHNYPGYGSQWDQMLYRDVAVTSGSSVDIRFVWSTHMDTRAETAPDLRIGWFDKDPLAAPAPFDGNFISSSDAGANAPVDSFMVYLGVPVQDQSCAYSDGSHRAVFDPLRRWFSEVIAIDQPYVELMTAAGVHEGASFSVSLPGGPGSLVQQMLDAEGGGDGTLRLVFRVKTNRGFDDGDYGAHGDFSSHTAGAAIVDDVVVNGWPAADGDFEAPDAIDDSAPSTDAWQVTGKPPGIYFHIHDIATLPYADPCGGVTAPGRQCDLSGHVMTAGDHDRQERPGGDAGTAFQDRHDLAGTPTINLCSHGPGDYNAQGIDAEIAAASGDIAMVLDLYTGGLKGAVNGNYWQVGWQCWPALQANGLPVWGEIRFPPVISSYTATECMTLVSRGARFDGALVTSNASGVPDSLRAYLQHVSRCFALPIAAADCSPATGLNAGIYFDNVSIAFMRTPIAPAISAEPWDLFDDTFPTSTDSTLLSAELISGGLAFDTCAARVRTGRNIAPSAGMSRLAVPGDSAVISAPGAGQRVDLVFRILPGPGDYVVIGDRTSGVVKRPDAVPRIAASPGDGSFWGSYLADDGAFGTGAPMDGVSPGPPHPSGQWDPNVWNSARCDTAELDLFPASGHGNLSALSPGRWATMLHEQDPRFGTLGVPKPRCFLIDPTAGTPVDDSNITCGAGTYPPAWTAQAATGFDPNEIPGRTGYTREYTPIIPDGLLTAGSHVEYFFRVSALATPSVGLIAPDTMRIVPQPWTGDLDGARWQEFSVLPDRWKDPAFGGSGMACMLYVDWSDRRGDQLDWVAVMDSVGGTRPERWGAHDGWHARGDQDPRIGVDPLAGGDPSMAVRAHLGQAGTLWDLFQLHGAESVPTSTTLGDRLAAQPGGGAALDRVATNGPTGPVLRAFYHTLVIGTGDLGAGGAAVMGPVPEHTDDDVTLLEDFANGGPGTPRPRAVWVIGRNLAESLEGPLGHPGFLGSFFGATLRSPDYRSLTGSNAAVLDLRPDPLLDANGEILGLADPCGLDNDVLGLNPATPGAALAAQVSDPTATGSPPFIDAVWAPASPTHPPRTLFESWRLRNVGARNTLTRDGLMRFTLASLAQLFAETNCMPLSSPVGVGDAPASSQWRDHFLLGSENPMRGDDARVVFGLTQTQRARVELFDIAGRHVRTLADRTFAAGVDHVLHWDGVDSDGHAVPPGVYFYRIVTPSFRSDRKIVVLRR